MTIEGTFVCCNGGLAILHEWLDFAHDDSVAVKCSTDSIARFETDVPAAWLRCTLIARFDGECKQRILLVEPAHLEGGNARKL